MKWFNTCKTVDEVKATFKKLAMLHHPDRGGNTETMQQINAEYSFAIAKLLSGGGFTETEINDAILESEAYKNALSKIVHLEGITIELVGNWIWVTGNTFAAKDTLKAAGFFWASKKQAWYFRSEAFKVRNYGQKMDLETIKGKYGCTLISGKQYNFING